MTQDSGEEPILFISHSTKDQVQAERLATELESLGWRTWLAYRDVRVGTNFAEAVVQSLSASSYVIVLVSTSSVASPHVRREVTLAVDRRIELLPVTLDEAWSNASSTPADWSYWLSTSQVVRFTSAKSTAEALSFRILEDQQRLSPSGPESTSTPNAVGRAPRSVPRSTLWLGAVVLGLSLLVVAGAVLVLLGREDAREAPSAALQGGAGAPSSSTESAAAVDALLQDVILWTSRTATMRNKSELRTVADGWAFVASRAESGLAAVPQEITAGLSSAARRMSTTLNDYLSCLDAHADSGGAGCSQEDVVAQITEVGREVSSLIPFGSLSKADVSAQLELAVSGQMPSSAAANPSPTSETVESGLAGKTEDVCAGDTGCSVGDRGPGGGVVFFDAGSRQPWGQYLEVAPSGWAGGLEDPTTAVTCTSDPGTEGWPSADTDTVVGSGRPNTESFVEKCGSSNAAGMAMAFRGGGLDDWFLPSKDELNELFLRKELADGLGGGCYWSSSQVGTWSGFSFEHYVWDQDFTSGGQVAYEDCGGDFLDSAVRPIRAF